MGDRPRREQLLREIQGLLKAQRGGGGGQKTIFKFSDSNWVAVTSCLLRVIKSVLFEFAGSRLLDEGFKFL